MKKINKLLLILLILFSLILITSCDDDSQSNNDEIIEEDKGIKIEALLKSSALEFNKQIDLNWNIEKLFKMDLKEYDFDLAKFNFITCIGNHNGVAVTINDKTTEIDNQYSYLKELGFSNFNTVKTYSNTVNDKEEYIDEDDTVRMVIAYGLFEGKNLFVVSFNGTNGDNEWASNFDVGCDNEKYKGEHPEWTNKNNHKGFDVAANRAWKVFLDFIEGLDINEDNETIIDVNGYSRGAAVANVFTAKGIDNEFDTGFKSVKFCAYTFATPNTNSSDLGGEERYKVIKNFINNDDIVPFLPTQKMGFTRYGEDIRYAIGDSEELTAFYKNEFDEIYNSVGMKNIITGISNLIVGRDAIYTIVDKEELRISKISEDQEEVIEFSNTWKQTLEDLGLDEYCEFSIIQTIDNSYQWYFVYSPELLFKLIPLYLNGDIDEDFDILGLLDCPKYKNVINSAILLSANPYAIVQQHLPGSYYTILMNHKK